MDNEETLSHVFMKISSYKDLIVWQKGMELVVEIYELTEHFPRSEMY